MNSKALSLNYFCTRNFILLASALLVCTFSLTSLAQTKKQYAQSSSQNNTQDWYYTFRPSDTMQSLGKSLLKRQKSWTDLVRYNRIENLASLQPGSIIKIPIHWLKQQPKPATVLSISGSALVKRVTDAQFKVMKPNTSIQIGDEISTRNGSVLIKFADNSVIRLEPNSSLLFNKLSHFGHTGMVDTRMRLKKGALSTEVSPLDKGSRYEISTPSAVAAVRGTEFRMESTRDSTQIEVSKGTVELRHAHGSTLVKAGEGARVRLGSAIVERENLAPAPKPIFANTSVSDLPATFRWKDPNKAQQYRYQLIDKNDGDKRILTSTLDKPEVTLTHVKNGDYRIAMRSIGDNGFEGIDSTSDVAVDIASLVPKLLNPLDGSILDNEEILFSWEFDNKQELGKLELARDPNFDAVISDFDFEFTNIVSIKAGLAPGEYYWRVVALADDSEESFSPTRKLSLKGLIPEIKILSVNYIGDQVGLFWKSLDKSRGYILQVSTSADFKEILREETLKKSSAHLKLTPGKRYFARVKSVEDSLQKSNYGPTKELFVKAP